MSGFSTYSAGQFLGFLKGSATDTPPTDLFVALYDGDPGDAGLGGTDITSTVSAGRAAVTFGSITSKAMSNDATVDFGNALADADCSHFGVWDDDTAGNFLGGAPLVAERSITTDNPVEFDEGTLTIGF